MLSFQARILVLQKLPSWQKSGTPDAATRYDIPEISTEFKLEQQADLIFWLHYPSYQHQNSLTWVLDERNNEREWKNFRTSHDLFHNENRSALPGDPHVLLSTRTLSDTILAGPPGY